MARNKYPEETISKIIDVSAKLFMGKGFENTSMQDIVDGLGGLSKGAIYHHFKSKEDILIAVMDRVYLSHDSEWDAVRMMDDGATGIEKLKAMFAASVFNERQDETFSMAPSFIKNPQMLSLQIQGIYNDSVPHYVQPIIEQGVADGSIQTQYPKELAEVLLILLNVWLTPMAREQGNQGLDARIGFLREMLTKLDLPIIDDAMIERLQEISMLFDQNGTSSTE
ncbi:TetR/AcrR family transcriptional regulator [Eubacteriales bacterium OttesenSCG-928-N13]|nr:TetR/AcrR family transcriptional regulator [Eubacteriales bacterium OttesenSCG-928-N13]